MRRFCVLMTVLACGLPVAAGNEQASPVAVDKEKRTITIDCKMAARKMVDPKYQGKIYPIEVIACWPYPRGQKAHETVVAIDFNPSEVHKALEELGLKPGKPIVGETTEKVQGPEVNVYLEVPGPGDRPRRVPIEKTMVDPKTNQPMPKVKWIFTGSIMSLPDPTKDEKVYGADLTGTLISIFPVTNETVFQTNLTMKEEKFLKLETNPKVVPPEGSPVKLIIEVPKKQG